MSIATASGVASYPARILRKLGRGSVNRPASRFLYVLPLIILLLGMTVYPFVWGLVASFRDYRITLRDPWIGTSNYEAFLNGQNPAFLDSLATTATIGGAALAGEFLLGSLLALFFWHAFRAKRFLATLILIPMLIAPVVVGITARMAFNDSFGFINQFISFFMGRDVQILWLAEPKLAVLAVILTDMWQWTPFIFLIVLAGLMSVSESMLEAARVDGARWWQQVRYILLPALRYVLIVAVVIRGLDLTKLFDTIIMMTFGGPGTATEATSLTIYFLAFRAFSFGAAAAASMLYLLVISVIVALALKLLSSDQFQRREVIA
ncbi:MAG: sugar ABC transporter permease [Actinomycetia bacterium]|nr:sugar ABC transporter permease [Actinomycetes bacterium]